MDAIVELIREFGFPVAIAGYLIYYLTRHLDTKLDRVIELLEKLATTI